ncbi:DUF7455 domain-containing protein [Myceligenerans xiligouense]|uniref:DUF7455 domain-containing protein n=1 Tax=Myceligenerans xiligouense TaxID=253184 RepID=A0A3N4ZI19_9MICO|nr:hypothetical protein EDD34_1110 [Myceligenerans xiligouense]
MALWSRGRGRPGHTRALPAQIDTCDRCGMRARLHVMLDNGGELYFCGHHAREYRAALKLVALTMDDVVEPGDMAGTRPG